MRKLLVLFATAFGLLAGFAAVLTARYAPAQPPAAPAAAEVRIPGGAAERLAGAIRIPTISAEDPAAFDSEAFRAFHAYLQASFPRVHAELRREIVGEYSLLYTWQGSDASLRPLLLAGHIDVVPVERDTENQWTEDPFGGRIAGGFIWGRGAIDNKSTVIATLEAVEMLLASGFRPARTVYLAFGHDEEVGGVNGARRIASLLRSRGVELEMVLDEGGVIGKGLMPGLDEPVAFVGIAEKGFVSLELSTRVAGGHSSLPPARTAAGILSAAVARLEANQMEARIEAPTHEMFNRVGPRFPALRRAVFANLWLTRPLVLRTLQARPSTNAMVRTTTAPTILQAGTKDNVLPSSARAVINFRILPGDSIASVREHVRRTIDDDRVEIRTAGRFSSEASPVSSTSSPSFKTLERTIRSVAPDAVVAPFLVVVATDARYYSGLSRDVYRFLPLRLDSEDLQRMHGTNERIAIDQYETAIRMYRQLILDGARDRALQEHRS